ncbi:MAG: type II toxin-antitoxin system PemK/MazF family toxin [SAR202 cluster bacterium]|nr:type II toxin-antitoxin system PemK/MazF family toxin [SAR202 cluster bacterium]
MIRRGDINWLERRTSGTVQGGRRPVLIIQNDAGNRTSRTTIVAAITSQSKSRPYPFHVPFTALESGLRLDGLVLCEQIQTVNQTELGAQIGNLPFEKMLEVDEALRRSLGLV